MGMFPFGGACCFLALDLAFWRCMWLFSGGCGFLAVDVAFWRWMLPFGGECSALVVDVDFWLWMLFLLPDVYVFFMGIHFQAAAADHQVPR